MTSATFITIIYHSGDEESRVLSFQSPYSSGTDTVTDSLTVSSGVQIIHSRTLVERLWLWLLAPSYAPGPKVRTIADRIHWDRANELLQARRCANGATARAEKCAKALSRGWEVAAVRRPSDMTAIGDQSVSGSASELVRAVSLAPRCCAAVCVTLACILYSDRLLPISVGLAIKVLICG
ncbi:hypothetical protein BJY04DRAFT_204028 [Aspergillus karnatakaensis]|uniref:uncharacterized protein n=1 Tax=Aspergillus karnatakaensis TaxID=1810916 RepID=UPI003CCE1B41